MVQVIRLNEIETQLQGYAIAIFRNKQENVAPSKIINTIALLKSVEHTHKSTLFFAYLCESLCVLCVKKSVFYTTENPYSDKITLRGDNAHQRKKQLTRAGGFCLCRRGFNRPLTLLQDIKSTLLTDNPQSEYSLTAPHPASHIPDDRNGQFVPQKMPDSLLNASD